MQMSFLIKGKLILARALPTCQIIPRDGLHFSVSSDFFLILFFSFFFFFFLCKTPVGQRDSFAPITALLHTLMLVIFTH